MAIRQYIGARYVPKYFENSETGDSTWASNTFYEALIMVTWNNLTYTSKIPVPASVGNPASAPQYWVITSNVNAQIDQLQEEVGNLSDTVDDIDDRVDTIDGRVTNINSSVENLDDRVDTIDGRVTNINSSVENLDDSVESIDGRVENIEGKFENGVLKPSAGGTGANSVDGAREALGLADNNFGSGVIVDSYTTSYYTIPSDGYVIAQCSANPNSKAEVRVYGADGETNYIELGGWGNSTYATYLTFVRKGMRIKVTTVENGGHVIYVPLA